MGKRKLDSDDDFSDSDYQFYAPSEPKTRKKRSSSRPHSDKKTRHKLDASEDLSPTPPHTKNTHTIKTTDITAIRSALLQWYSTVHDSRNMPWRKRYDPTLGREGRAQRAYEAKSNHSHSELCSCHANRCGYRKLCFSKHRLLRLFLITIGGLRSGQLSLVLKLDNIDCSKGFPLSAILCGCPKMYLLNLMMSHPGNCIYRRG